MLTNRFASRRQWTFEAATWYLDNSFVTAKTLTLLDLSTRMSFFSGRVSLKNLNLNNFMFQKKASLPELIMGSYMMVLTFEFASL